jgi:hypothetical protein
MKHLIAIVLLSLVSVMPVRAERIVTTANTMLPLCKASI